MEIKFIKEGELLTKVGELVADSVEISIASAFLSFEGFSILKKYLEKHDQIKSIQILIDENFHPDEKTKMSLLNKIVELPNTEVRLFCDDKKLFHAKIYFFKGAEKIHVVVGSSNLTGGGFLHNIEMNTLFVSDSEDAEILRLRNIYNQYWERGITAKEFANKIGGGMSSKDFKLGDKVHISNKLELGIGKVVDISGDQVDIYFKETGVAETAHINSVELALDPLDMAKKGIFDDPIKFDLRIMSILLPLANKNGILSNSIIEILPHQILAAHKVITSSTRKFLLADEVGLGKTFEAGIIVKELISRKEASRILIITPASLVYQWQDDMKRFGLNFTIYQSGYETSIIDFWNSMNLIITSIDTIKIDENMEKVIGSKEWDVIIFDEAHHLTRKDYGDKANKSDRYKVGEQLRDKTKAILFLTATPHQGDRNKFYNLVNLLDDSLFNDENDFFYNREKLGQIMIRQRKIDVTDDEGKPLFVKRIVNALRYTPSDEENQFYRHLNDYLYTGYRTAEGDSSTRYRALGFVMVTFQKIAASSVYAIKTALLERLIRLLFIEIVKCNDELTAQRIRKEIILYAKNKYPVSKSEEAIFSTEKNNFDKYVNEEGIDPFDFVATPDEINSLKNLLSYVPKNEDTKLQELMRNINLIKSQNSEEKFIIFTEYLGTQDYIVSKLREKYDETDVVFIRGGDHQEKINAAKTFKKSAHFLVSTQAGGEGINLQHCHILINYDMPWNPMKVEQRIGRIHRYKQKDTVQVYNMFARDTVEDRIYDRLEDKLSEISQMIGNDDEREAFRENILGIIVEELNFDELYKEVLKKGQNEINITQEKIDNAIQRAKEIYEKLGDFTQDLEKFNLEKYFKTKGKINLEDVKNFVLKFIQSEGKRVATDQENNYEFIIPDIIQSYGGLKQSRATFDREKAIEDPALQFMAIGNHVTDSIIRKCSSHGYGGRCVIRQISSPAHKGEAGVQLNHVIEYQDSLPGHEKNKTIQKEFISLMFDKEGNYRKDLEELGLFESEKKKIKEEEFAFINQEYIGQIEVLAQKKLQEIIEENVKTIQQQYPDVIYKHNLESVAFFAVK